MAYPYGDEKRFFPSIAIAGASFGVLHLVGEPVFTGSSINGVSAFLVTIGVIASANVIRIGSSMIADWLKVIGVSQPKGNKGKAEWAKWKDFKKDIKKHGWGTYWGYFKPNWYSRKRLLISEISSNAIVFGPSGSGKGVCSVLPNILSIKDSKLILDFKSNVDDMVREPLEARGEKVICVDAGGLYKQRTGRDTASYNLLHILIHGFLTKDGLADIEVDANGLAQNLYQKSEDSKEDPYWSEGAYELLEMAFLQAVLTHGEEANIAHAYKILANLSSLKREMEWVCGKLKGGKNGGFLPAMPLEQSPWVKNHDPLDVKGFIEQYRGRAQEILDTLETSDKSNQAQTFLKGAKNALKPFSRNSRSYKSISHSTFCFGDMKEEGQVINVILAMDSSRMEQQGRVVAALEYAALAEWKRHKNKHVKIIVVGDETTNAKIKELPSLMTWGREYNIINLLYIQSIGAARTPFGKEFENILMSETEAKLFLAGQRDPEMLDLIENLCGQQSIIAKNHNKSKGTFGLSGSSIQEDGKPLITADEIRRMDKAILILQKNKPILVDVPPISSIHPWRTQIGINHFFGKPYLEKIRLRIGDRKANIFYRLYQHIFKRGKS